MTKDISDHFSMIMYRAVNNFQALSAAEKERLLRSILPFGDKLFTELFDSNLFDTLCDEMHSMGVIGETLYLALREGADIDFKDRDIISIAKYSTDTLEYEDGSDTLSTIPMFVLDKAKNRISTPISFLRDPLSAYLVHILGAQSSKGSVIHIQEREISVLDEYSYETLMHTQAIKGRGHLSAHAQIPLACMHKDVQSVYDLFKVHGFEPKESKHPEVSTLIVKDEREYVLHDLRLTDKESENTREGGLLSQIDLLQKNSDESISIQKAIKKIGNCEHGSNNILTPVDDVFDLDVNTMSVDSISKFYQPRMAEEADEYINDKEFSALVASIKKVGILTPLVVRVSGTKYKETEGELLDGHRRLAAAKEIGLSRVPVVTYTLNDKKALVLSIISNTKRKNLSPIEIGFAYKKLIDDDVVKTQRELAELLSINESTVAAAINHLKLDHRIIDELMRNRTISDQKVLKSLRTIEKVDENGESSRQIEAYEYIVSNKLGRIDALIYLKEVKGKEEISSFEVKRSKNAINLAISTVGLNKEKVSEIEALISKIEVLRSSN